MPRQQRNGGNPATRSRSSSVTRSKIASQRHNPQGNGTRSAEPSREAIAEAAYFLWLERGGNDFDNWVQAEASLRSRGSLNIG